MAAIFGEAWTHKDELQVGAYFAAFREAGLSVGKIKNGLKACRTEWQGDFPPKPGQFVGLCKPKKETPPHWQAYTPQTALCASCGRESEHVNTYAAGGYLAAVQCRSCGFSTRTLPKPKKLPPQGVFEKIRSAIKR